MGSIQCKVQRLLLLLLLLLLVEGLVGVAFVLGLRRTTGENSRSVTVEKQRSIKPEFRKAKSRKAKKQGIRNPKRMPKTEKQSSILFTLPM